MPPILVRTLTAALATIVLVLVTAGLTVRFWVWPQIEQFLNDPEALSALAAPALDADRLSLQARGAQARWDDWLAPQIALERVQITDSAGRSTLVAEGVRARFGLSSLLSLVEGLPVFSRLEFDRISVLGERDAEGRLKLGGFALSQRDQEPSLWYELATQQGPLWVGQLTLSWRDAEAFGSVDLESLRVRLQPNRLTVRVSDLNLAAWLPLAQRLDWVPGETALSGSLRNAVIEWEGDLREAGDLTAADHLRRISVEADLEAVSARQLGRLAELSSLSGRLSLAAGSGRLSLLPGPLELSLPRDFSAGPLRFTRAQGELEWRVTDWKPQANGLPTGLLVSVQRASVESPDVSAELSGTQEILGTDLGKADFTGEVTKARADRVFYYLPSTVGRDARDWVRRAFVSSTAVSGRFKLSGEVAEFPFDQRPGAGRFDAQLALQETALHVAPGWPLIRAPAIQLGFAGPELSLRAAKAQMGEAALINVVGRIPHLDDRQPRLEISGRFDSPLRALLDTVNQSPVRRMLGGITEGAVGSGRALLGLALVIDLNHPDLTTVKGELEFDRSTLALEGVPELSGLTGRLRFDEQGLTALGLRGRSLGGGMSLTLGDSRQQLLAQGDFQAADLERWLREALAVPLYGVLQGQTSYGLRLEIARSRLQLRVQSSLKGLTLALPAPLRKPADEAWGLQLDFDRRRAGQSFTDLVSMTTQDQRLGLQFERVGPEGSATRRAGLAVNGVATLPADPGMVIQANAVALPLVDWIRAIEDRLSPPVGTGGPRKEGLGEPLLRQVQVQADQLRLGPFDFQKATLQAQRQSGQWALGLESREAAGQFIWRPSSDTSSLGSRGALVARLSRLWLAPSMSAAGADPDPTALQEGQRWPSVDLVAEDFRRGKIALGRLVIDAAPRPQDNSWEIQRLSLENPQAELRGTGRWAAKGGSAGASETSMDLTLQVRSGEGLLDRLGYPGLIKDTPGSIQGRLAWDGAPTDFGLRALRGKLALDFESGRFMKVDPGPAKLLSVLNLQSLPKRMTLDFRDIFSEGFGYDRVRGDLQLNQGVAQTQNLRIVGVQASVFIEGSASLINETQNTRVLVLPELNAGLASLGYALVNPAIGLGSFLAQYVLRDPLREILAYEYALSGPWENPVVREVPRSEQRQP